MSRSASLGRTTNSLTKDLNRDGLLCKRAKKRQKAILELRGSQTHVKAQMRNGTNDQMYRRTLQIIIGTPVLSQGITAVQPGEKYFELNLLRVEIRRKTIHRMGAPPSIENFNCLMLQPVGV